MKKALYHFKVLKKKAYDFFFWKNQRRVIAESPWNWRRHDRKPSNTLCIYESLDGNGSEFRSAFVENQKRKGWYRWGKNDSGKTTADIQVSPTWSPAMTCRHTWHMMAVEATRGRQRGRHLVVSREFQKPGQTSGQIPPQVGSSHGSIESCSI